MSLDPYVAHPAILGRLVWAAPLSEREQRSVQVLTWMAQIPPAASAWQDPGRVSPRCWRRKLASR